MHTVTELVVRHLRFQRGDGAFALVRQLGGPSRTCPGVGSQTRSAWCLIFFVLPVLLGRAGAEQANDSHELAQPRTVQINHTFNGVPFTYRIVLKSQEEGFRVYRLTYPSPMTTEVEENNIVPAEYYLPENIAEDEAKRPAVICLHILSGNFELVRLLCSVLAEHGIPAMMFKLPYYGERAPPGGRQVLLTNGKLFAQLLTQAVQDVRRAVDFLASQPAVDPTKIGIAGVSFGGVLAGTLAGMEMRFHRAALILAGGDVLTIVHHAHETRQLSAFLSNLPLDERRQIEQTFRQMDPLSHVERLREMSRAGKVLMVNASEDEVIPRACTEKLAAALGIEDDVVWLDGLGHYTAIAALPQVLDAIVEFFARDLPSGVQRTRPTGAPSTAVAMVGQMMKDLTTMLVVPPRPGYCYFLDCSAVFKGPSGNSHQGEIQFIRGSGGRFRLRCRLPGIDAAVLGQCEYPWMASVGKKVFRGVKEPMATSNPMTYVEPELVMKARMAVGLLSGFGAAPQAVGHMIEVFRETDDTGAPVVVVKLKQKWEGQVRIRFSADGRTPNRLTFDVQGVSGTVDIRQWQINAISHDELFREPGELATQEVLQQDVYRMFAALIHLAVEKVKVW